MGLSISAPCIKSHEKRELKKLKTHESSRALTAFGICLFAWHVLSIHLTKYPKLASLLPKPKRLSPTLHKLAAAHASLTHNCQSIDTAGSEEEWGEGERRDEGRRGRRWGGGCVCVRGWGGGWDKRMAKSIRSTNKTSTTNVCSRKRFDMECFYRGAVCELFEIIQTMTVVCIISLSLNTPHTCPLSDWYQGLAEREAVGASWERRTESCSHRK